ncbi:MAG: phage tail tape measure protein [Hyphomicrobiaceae bacterium]
MANEVFSGGVPMIGLSIEEIAQLQTQIDAMTASQRQFGLELANSTQLGRQFGRTMTSAFLDLAIQGKGLGDVMRTLALGLSRLALGAAFKPLESAFGTAFQSLLAAPSPFTSAGMVASPTGLSSVTSAAASHIAGPVASRGFDAVARSAAAPTSIVLNISTPDVESFRRSETQVAAMLARVVGQGHRNL